MSDRIAETIDGFGEMNVSQVGFNTYRVTSWRNDGLTHHEVDLREGSCTCEDYQMNRQGSDACAHLIKVGHLAETTRGTEQMAARRVAQEAHAVEQAAQSIEQTATSIESHQQAGGSQTASQPADDGSSDGVDDPVAAFNAVLEDHGLDPDDFDVHIDDQYGSLQATNDGYLDDGDFGKWQDVADELDLTWDGDNERYYLKPDNFGEVLG